MIQDKASVRGDKNKLGKLTVSSGVPTIYNLYGQYNWGPAKDGTPPLNYEALNSAFALMAVDLRATKFTGTIGLPRLGAGLAGGDWNKIEPIILKHLSSWNIEVYSL